jgi:hypothetical protein
MDAQPSIIVVKYIEAVTALSKDITSPISAIERYKIFLTITKTLNKAVFLNSQFLSLWNDSIFSPVVTQSEIITTEIENIYSNLTEIESQLNYINKLSIELLNYLAKHNLAGNDSSFPTDKYNSVVENLFAIGNGCVVFLNTIKKINQPLEEIKENLPIVTTPPPKAVKKMTRYMEEASKEPKRPTSIFVICVLFLISAFFTIPLIFLPISLQIGAWYPPFLAFSSVVGLICMVGFWNMKKWAVYTYIGFTAFNQVVMIAMGVWNVFALIGPAILIFFLLKNVSKMT